MKKQFVTYEIALALKELEFDEECLAWYIEEDPPILIFDRNLNEDNGQTNSSLELSKIEIAAPLWQQAIGWLENKLEACIVVGFDDEKLKWGFYIYPKDERECWGINLSYKDRNKTYIFENRYLATEQAILKAIEIVKKEKIKNEK